VRIRPAGSPSWMPGATRSVPSSGCGSSAASSPSSGRIAVQALRPAREEVKRLVCSRVRFRHVHEDALSRVAGKVQGFVGQSEIAHDGVVKVLHAASVEPDVVGRPADTELLAARGQLANQVSQGSVIGVSSGLGAQGSNDVVGDVLPVDEQIGGAAMEEDVTRGVGWVTGAGEQFGAASFIATKRKVAS
jgi:hypothetical protein